MDLKDHITNHKVQFCIKQKNNLNVYFSYLTQTNNLGNILHYEIACSLAWVNAEHLNIYAI